MASDTEGQPGGTLRSRRTAANTGKKATRARKPAASGKKAAEAPAVASTESQAASAAESESPAAEAPKKAAAPAGRKAATPASSKAGDARSAPDAAPANLPSADAPAGAVPGPEPSAASEEASELAPRPAPSAEEAGSGAGGSPARLAEHPIARLAAASALPEQLAHNIERIEALTHRLVAALAQRPLPNPAVDVPGPDFYLTAAGAMMKQLAEQPTLILQHQTRFWGETLRHYAETQAQLLKGNPTPAADPEKGDRRFRNPLWNENPFFAYVRKQYQINAEALSRAVSDLDIEDQVERRRMEWFTRQLIDMMAPTNFLATNPDALERAVATEGESLVKGLENLVADIEAAGGQFSVSLVDKSAFAVGENIATTPGDVVFRHPLFELIQYRPTTGEVHDLPLILFPPWINKFYILDMKPQNSMIRYLVDKGFTLFVVSWKNPGPELGGTSMDDYVRAFLQATDEARRLTGSPQVNAVGYCIGGTALHLTLAHLAHEGDDRIASATFFTTLTDFSEQGEFTTFLQDDFVGGIEDEVRRKGILGAQLMARTFSFLRANDLIWGPAIRSYMLGETPPAFDLLYWNADATNLPGQMAVDYLRGICQSNDFADGEGFAVLGRKVGIEDVKVPLCSVACEGDHIAPWVDCWRGFSMTGSEDRTFILSQSGHIAGIINPPGRNKYGHYTSEAGFGGTAEDWRKAAQFHEGSWWPTWHDWLAPRSGPMVPAREPAESLAPAPGTYVHETAAAVAA